MKLNETICYTPGGIANKVILRNSSGMIVLLAVDKGAEIATHSAHANVLVQILEGACDFTVDGETRRLNTGDFLTMDPDTPHSLNAPESFKALVTKINA